eukprot:gene5340-3906_t
MSSGIAGDQQQWFNAFRLFLAGKELASVGVKKQMPGSNATKGKLSTLDVVVEGAEVTETNVLTFRGVNIDVSQDETLRIGH